MQKTIEIEVGNSTIKIETKRWAKQSNGSALCSYEDNVILVTANMKDEVKETKDFLPLMVDFRENTYAAGKIPGGFFKREGRPSEKEVLLSRLIDRPIRPLFDENHFRETQVIAMLLSADFSIDYDALGIIGASAALLSSTIPFSTPVGAVKIGWKGGEFLINPGQNTARDLDMVLLAVGTEKDIVMMEAGGNEFSEELTVEGIRRAKEIITRICQAQKALIHPEKSKTPGNEEVKRIAGEIKSRYADRIRDAIFTLDRTERDKKLKSVTEEMVLGKEDEKELARYKNAFPHVESEIFRTTLLKEKRRTDHRAADEIRPIFIELGVLPRVHGSAVFTRGETQALATITLGSEDDAQRLDNLNGDESRKKFMLHYNFPPFSVGEVSFLRGAGRREIGHGNLAERSLRPLIPTHEEWPYTIRQVSDILESNGSSSMASVCGGALSLMDAGVPMKAPVAGIAMGLVMEGEKFAILTDIAGAEDHHGDMDFKVAGTRKGITSLQMDIKITGVTRPVMEKALAQARAGRMFILDVMQKTLEVPRKEISEFAPRIITIRIPKDKIREVIGPGGKTIRSIVERTGAKIDIDDDGRVDIASIDEASAQKAVDIIRELTAEAELGRIYLGKVVRVVNFGAFVEILPGVEGLQHISEISEQRIKEVRDEINDGDEVLAKVIDIDAQGRVRVSRKAAMKEAATKEGNKPLS